MIISHEFKSFCCNEPLTTNNSTVYKCAQCLRIIFIWSIYLKGEPFSRLPYLYLRFIYNGDIIDIYDSCIKYNFINGNGIKNVIVLDDSKINLQSEIDNEFLLKVIKKIDLEKIFK